ncbi:winged helix-turn-helix domain-containing protein [Vibrio apostichopi]|uniref:winged helix-turn-helix domain-containing protein n=1 Tax=Vibrio apostichopi TaxID=3035453 RepID=UPI002573007A|nr:helix-turn-helix domain-containing protein [Vibrio sp. FE10]
MKLQLHEGSLKAELFDPKENKTISKRFSRSEFLILRELLAHSEVHLTKEHLTQVGWPDSYVGENSLNMVIMTLRKKLAILGDFLEITTIYRVGYSLNFKTGSSSFS